MAKDISEHIKYVRREFNDTPLLEKDIMDNPMDLFSQWMEEATAADLLDPFAMCFSTVDKIKGVDSRILYLRGMTDEGYIFYTNYDSDKGRQILEDPRVGLNFFWNEISRQVKINGVASKIDSQVSDEYFAKRPRRSQLGAWASDQSQVLLNRDALDKKLEEVENTFENKEVERPPNWGGIIVKPTYFEFWKGRASRLHDRYTYELIDGIWKVKRLSP